MICTYKDRQENRLTDTKKAQNKVFCTCEESWLLFIIKRQPIIALNYTNTDTQIKRTTETQL